MVHHKHVFGRWEVVHFRPADAINHAERGTPLGVPFPRVPVATKIDWHLAHDEVVLREGIGVLVQELMRLRIAGHGVGRHNARARAVLGGEDLILHGLHVTVELHQIPGVRIHTRMLGRQHTGAQQAQVVIEDERSRYRVQRDWIKFVRREHDSIAQVCTIHFADRHHGVGGVWLIPRRSGRHAVR